MSDVELRSPINERRTTFLRARLLLRVAIGALAFAAVGGVLVVLADPSRWWVWAIAYVAIGYLEIRNVRRLSAVNHALRQESHPAGRT